MPSSRRISTAPNVLHPRRARRLGAPNKGTRHFFLPVQKYVLAGQAFIFLPVQENEAKEHAKEGTQRLSPPWNHPRAEEGTTLLLAWKR